jgi:hypothetical protein
MSERMYSLLINGRRSGRSKAIAEMFKANPSKKLLVRNVRTIDVYVSLGVQPSQLILLSEIDNSSEIKEAGCD